MTRLPEQSDVVVVGLGALGSAAAFHLARRGLRVVGLEQFDLGHVKGASHDTSRILRHSYHTPEYIELTKAAYDDWADLESESGEDLVTVVGGLDFFPPGAAIPVEDYTRSMEATGIPFESLDVAAVAEHWPQFHLPDGTVSLYQARSAIVPAARGTATMQARARAHRATLIDNCPATSLQPDGDGVLLTTPLGRISAERVVLTADAWTNHLLAGLGLSIPLTTTVEQVTYFAPPDPSIYQPDRMPLWIWMDEPSFYGFPCYGEATVKAAEDCGGPVSDPDDRPFTDDPGMRERLVEHLARMLPQAGAAVRSVRCLYTLTPDRDFVLDAAPGHPNVVVGLGAGHGFKFAPTFGRLLADLVESGSTSADIHDFRLDRPGLTDPDYSPHWLI